MDYIIPIALGAVILAVMLLALEWLRALKPRLYLKCGQSFHHGTNALECTLNQGHSGVHGSKYGKTNVWWENET